MPRTPTSPTWSGDVTEGAIQSEGPAGAPTHYSVRTDEEGREELPSPPTDVVCILEATAGVSGSVAAAGEPVPGATVSLYAAAGSGAATHPTTTTDRQGSFDFGELDPGASGSRSTDSSCPPGNDSSWPWRPRSRPRRPLDLRPPGLELYRWHKGALTTEVR